MRRTTGKSPWTFPSTGFQQSGDCKDLLQSFERAIESTRNSLDHIALQKAARLLAYSDLIHVYGRGESLIIAEDFHYKLIRIGMNSVLETQNGFQEARSHVQNPHIRESALVVSQYCNSPQVHYIIDD